MPQWVYWLTPFVLVAVGWLVWGVLRRASRRRQVAAAHNDFAANHAQYEQEFFAAAAASGKPRGLRWTECRFHDAPAVTARDKASGELVNLASVTISFEAVEGGGMEDVEAVGNLRCATAVFTWNGRAWTTQGRAAFNLEPYELLERYSDSLEPVPLSDT